MHKMIVASITFLVLSLFAFKLGLINQLVLADNTKIWVNNLKKDSNNSIPKGKIYPLKPCECSNTTKLGEDLNYVWNCRCGSKQCVISGRYDGSHIFCSNYIDSLL